MMTWWFLGVSWGLKAKEVVVVVIAVVAVTVAAIVACFLKTIPLFVSIRRCRRRRY